jgi:subfamily B ATP-binding cassette protein MsbA
MIAFLLKVWGLARPYRFRLALGFITGIISGFIEPLAIATFTFVFQVIFSPGGGVPTLTANDIKDLPRLEDRLGHPQDGVSKFLVGRFSADTRDELASAPALVDTNLLKERLVSELNLVLTGSSIYEPSRFAGVQLTPQTQRLMAAAPGTVETGRLNRFLLEDAFPLELAKNRSSLRSGIKGVPTVMLDRIPQWVWNGLDSTWQSLREGVGKHPTAVICLVALIPAVIFLRGLFSYLNMYFLQWAAIRAITDLRIRLFEHIMSLSASFFNQSNTGELMSRVMNDTGALQNIISNATAVIVKDPATLIGLAAYVLWKAPKLTLISMLVMPLCMIPIIVFTRKVRRSAGSMQGQSADIAVVMAESFTGNRIIKAYNLEDNVVGQFRQAARRMIGHYMRIVRASELPGPLMELFGAMGVALVFLYLAFGGGNRAGYVQFLTIILAIFSMYRPLKNLARLQNNIEQARASSARVFELLATESTIPEPANPKPLDAVGKEIQFEDIHFGYRERVVLHGVDLTVKPGQLVALVGASGSGKTTLTNLLLRFYDPQRGAVLIGGTDIREVSSRTLRNQMAVVTQETVLFNETIGRNIEMGRPGASRAEIEAAARHAHAHDFILEKPKGYDTVVGERGVELSGGQRQRIAIARALLRNAPILILDEATNSLDTEAERVVQAALEGLMQGRTTICIAHRLTTIQRADMIIVMDQGKIVETGCHADLLARNGTYRHLYDLQFQTAEAAE